VVSVSYARLGENSDVHVYADAEVGYLRCVGCNADFSSTDAMIEHLRNHIASGDTVPATVIPAVEADRAKNDEWLATARRT
jgi:hypothetical protein